MRIDIVSDDTKRRVSISLGELVLILLAGMASIGTYLSPSSLETDAICYLTTFAFIICAGKASVKVLRISFYDWRHPVKIEHPSGKHPWNL